MADEQDKQDINDRANRLFQHGLHEHNAFIQMGNYFLIAESMFVVAYAGLLSSNQTSANILLVARILAFFGFLLTVVWIYVNRRQWQILRHLQEKARELVPEYKVTYETRPKPRISATALIAYFVPTPIAVMWIIFVFIA